MSAPEKESPAVYYDPLRPLGIFLTVFGVSVLFAVFIEMPLFHRLMNLAVGLTILGMGLAFWGVGHRRAQKAKEKKAG